jgi:hypothetical protein
MGALYILIGWLAVSLVIFLCIGLLRPNVFVDLLGRFAQRRYILLIGAFGLIAIGCAVGFAQPSQPRQATASTTQVAQVGPAAVSKQEPVVQSAKIELKEVTQVETIPFPAQQQTDSAMLKGQSRIVQVGINGEKSLVFEVTLTDGTETKRVLKRETVTKQPVPQVTTIGSRVPPPAPTPQPAPQASAKCVIKGNISSSGEKIYHVPGQRYYDETVISPNKGERYFCSAAEAQAAGWRAAKL